jgi:L-fuconolactonase
MFDSHFHVWNINKKYYRWLTPDLKVLYRTFSLKDYEQISFPFTVNSCIVVQAADDICESKYLIELANENSLIKGVIGWIDFDSNDVLKNLDSLTQSKYLKGIRPMIQDISDVNWINNPKYYPIFETLVKKNLVFEALIKQEHITNIIQIAKKYPTLKIVVNHGSKPIIDGNINSESFLEWARLITEISLHKNVYCKFSGLVTECTSTPTFQILEPYLKHLLESFSSQRIIWGSDWPVVNLKCTYREWVAFTKKFISGLTECEQNNILENNAKKIYLIKD